MINNKETFEDFLEEKHAEEHIGTKETLVDSFNDWLGELEIDDVIKYADEYISIQRQEIIKMVEDMVKYRDTEKGGYNKAIVDVVTKIKKL